MLVNSAPSRTVRARPCSRPWRSPWMRAWCAQVTVQPDSSRIMVLRNGRWKASKTSTPTGGQTPPVCSLRATCIASPGNRLASKKAQKKAEKNITSRSEERRVGKECVVRVDLGGRRIIKKKKEQQAIKRHSTNTHIKINII